MRDPESAQFRNTRRCPGDADMVIGEVNARNGYGGYTGFRGFIVKGGVAHFDHEDVAAYSGLIGRCLRGEAAGT
jgi:hypothetical protein